MTSSRRTAQGIPTQLVKDLLRRQPASELAEFLLRGMKDNGQFHRKVLAWLISEHPSILPDEMALAELTAWVDDVFAEPGHKPRTPNLTELNPVRAAVRKRPAIAVPVHIAIVQGISGHLHAYGGGPTSHYSGLVRAFRDAAQALLALDDPEAQEKYLQELESLASGLDDLGYGVDAATQECLDDTMSELGEVRQD